MMRRFASNGVASRAALLPTVATRRNYVGSNLVAHCSQVTDLATFTSLSTISMSPLGTVAMVALSYNVSVVGMKHLWYTLEFIARDYLQDVVAAQCFRYMILVVLMLTVGQQLIEV